MKRIFLVATILTPVAAYAQGSPPAAAPAKPDVILVTRQSILGLMQGLNAIGTLHPELITPVVNNAFAAVAACIRDNPDPDGRLTRMGEDQCLDVTTIMGERTKEITDLKSEASNKAKEITALMDEIAKLQAAEKHPVAEPAKPATIVPK